jgi:hypothetical protein
MRATDTEIRHVTLPDGNVFSDLGFDDVEASKLLAEPDRMIGDALVIKSGHVHENK